jgi:hypothetical protein
LGVLAGALPGRPAGYRNGTGGAVLGVPAGALIALGGQLVTETQQGGLCWESRPGLFLGAQLATETKHRVGNPSRGSFWAPSWLQEQTGDPCWESRQGLFLGAPPLATDNITQCL